MSYHQQAIELYARYCLRRYAHSGDVRWLDASHALARRFGLEDVVVACGRRVREVGMQIVASGRD